MVNPLVSIIIITKNQKHFLAKTLPLLTRQDYPQREIIVVDSGSTDGAVELIKKHRVELISVPSQPPGLFNYAQALNTGVRKAKGELIIRIPGDATPANTYWLRALITPLLCFEKVALVFGQEIARSKRGVYEQFKFKIVDSKKKKWFVKEWELKSNPACMAFRKDLWDTHHFNETWLWGEEVEWMLWCLKHNYHIVYEPEAKVIHSHGLPLDKELIRLALDVNLMLKVLPSFIVSFNGSIDKQVIKQQLSHRMEKLSISYKTRVSRTKEEIIRLYRQYQQILP